MSALETYTRLASLNGDLMPSPFWVIGDDGAIVTSPAPPIEPGCWVTHQTLGGTGMVIAINDENLTVLWSIEPRTIDDFNRFVLPLITRRVNPGLIAQQILQVQPMTAPVGMTFYLDYVYGGDKWLERCTIGPLWRRVLWRGCKWLSTKLSAFGSSLRSLSRSWSSSSCTNARLTPRKGWPVHKRHSNVLQDPDRMKALVDKWNTGLTQPTETPDKG